MKVTKKAAKLIQMQIDKFGFVRCAALADMPINTLRACIQGKNINGQTAERVASYINMPLSKVVESSNN